MLTDKLMKDFQSITTLNFKILELWHSKTEKSDTWEEVMDTLMILLYKQIEDFQKNLFEALKQ